MSNKHEFLSELLKTKENNSSIELEYSHYLPGDKGETKYREIFHCSFLNNFAFEGFDFNYTIYEVALHSKIKINKQYYHIPMVDFNIASDTKNIIGEIEKLKVFDSKFYIYNSGRSFHGYYLKLLTKKEWYKYLGTLLLLNDRKKPFKYIDSRWIGHSLEHGYSALRITKNTKMYLAKPKLIGVF